MEAEVPTVPCAAPTAESPAVPPIAPTKGIGIKAGDRARPLTDLGRRLLGVHLVKTTPKEK